jgi:hypothetical protein
MCLGAHNVPGARMPFPPRPNISDKDKAASDTETVVSTKEKDNGYN